ncbi:MAG: DUF167 domain-containing protein [bacterium]|nr:DUF167 domain-containing protein [bacterium]MDZ4284747.1 DUF167 domain-containing protein [Patescibacteria group bacterium]
MKVFIKAKPNARREAVEKIDESHFVVSVQAPARRGKANAGVAHAIAAYFGVSPSRIRLVSGASAKNKVFEVA